MVYEEVMDKFVTERSHGIHRMQTTSVDAFFNLENLNGRRKLVFEAICELNEMGVCPTDLEIMKHLGFYDPNKVRPRRFELVDLGLIEEAGTKVCSVSQKVVLCWRAFDVQPLFDKQGEVFVQKSLTIPYEEWIKLKDQMEKHGYFYDGNGRWKK